jgi:DNA repair protein RadC
VLTHPAFDRPPVWNERRRGPKKGAVSLACARRERESQAVAAQQAALRRTPARDVQRELLRTLSTLAPELSADACDERATIAAALSILDARLRRPGACLTSPELMRAYLALHLGGREAEAFTVLFLDAQHCVIEAVLMFEGTLTETRVYPREVVRAALRLNAAAVVLAHNHPSGSPEPSAADEHLTRVLSAALRLVDVRVLDHVVIGRLSAVSMAERGLM